MGQDQRSLHRLQQKFNAEIRATLLTSKGRLTATVLDYHSAGVRLQLEQELPERIEALELYFGGEKIGTLPHPRVLRMDSEQRRLVLSLVESQRGSQQSRPERIAIDDTHRGFLMGLDPMKLQETVYFHIVNLSLDGCRVISSKSNRHLTPGLKLENFDLMLPGLGAYKVDFEIANVRPTEQGIEFGGRLKSSHPGFERVLRKSLLLNSRFDLEKDRDVLKQLVAGQKDYGPLIRMMPVRDERQFEEILKRRFSAYKQAGKIKEGMTWKDLRDPYDDQALNYAILIGRTVVGTLRIVFSEKGSALPFEEYLRWDEIPALKSRDRSEVGEVSRLAIDPLFQGSDIFLHVYRNIIVEIGMRGIAFPVCMATKELAPYYRGIGAVPLSAPVPHPQVPGETLKLYLFDRDRIVQSRMNALGWHKVVKPALGFLKKKKFISGYSSGWIQWFKLPLEALAFYLQKRKRRKNRLQDTQSIASRREAS